MEMGKLSKLSKVLQAAGIASLAFTATLSAHEASLPLGDGSVTSSPQVGSVVACQTNFRLAGVVKDEPWIQGDIWFPDEKPIVSGAVDWPGANIVISVVGDERIVSTAGLPTHPTGEFPIDRASEAYKWDRNPNAIIEHDIALRLPANPRPAAEPSCLPMGMIGFALSGAAIFNALDAAGLDAAAHEVQDACNGHPQGRGLYHYHNGSSCLEDTAADGTHSDLIGYALDGFGIYGNQGDSGKELSNDDLDACHGHVGEVLWDGALRRIYHYHLTNEYPYTLGCFVGTAVQVR